MSFIGLYIYEEVAHNAHLELGIAEHPVPVYIPFTDPLINLVNTYPYFIIYILWGQDGAQSYTYQNKIILLLFISAKILRTWGHCEPEMRVMR